MWIEYVHLKNPTEFRDDFFLIAYEKNMCTLTLKTVKKKVEEEETLVMKH